MCVCVCVSHSSRSRRARMSSLSLKMKEHPTQSQTSIELPTFRRHTGIVRTKLHGDFIDTPFPIRIRFSWHACDPFEHIGTTIAGAFGSRVKANGMILAPCFALFAQSAIGNAAGHILWDTTSCQTTTNKRYLDQATLHYRGD
jgi:hypothetical protein